jgi:hypothetical protein
MVNAVGCCRSGEHPSNFLGEFSEMPLVLLQRKMSGLGSAIALASRKLHQYQDDDDRRHTKQGR